MAKTKRRLKSLLKNVGVLSPVIVSLSGFAAIVAFWDGFAEWLGLGKLGLIERLAFGAAMSWVMFLLTDLVKEVIGMLTLTSRRENWREEIAAEERSKASAIAAKERAKASAIVAEERAKASAIVAEERAKANAIAAEERAKARAEAREEMDKERVATMELLASERAKDREERAAERAKEAAERAKDREIIMANQETIRENQETIRVLLQHLAEERERKTDD